MHVEGVGREGPEWRCSSLLARRSRGEFPLFLGQQRRRGICWVVGVTESWCGSEVSVQRRARVLGGLIS
jgi:hypothetical protein